MIVELISVGTELLMGNIVNTNVAYLAKRCANLGGICYYQSVVGDNPGRLKDTMKQALNRSDVVILTGGLGPTQDDLTKQTAAELFGRTLYMDEDICEHLRDYFSRKGKECMENNFRQAMIPTGSKILYNHNGTAPGIYLFDEKKHMFLLPGPPFEMKPMFEEYVADCLASISGEVIHSDVVKICGVAESTAEMMVKDLIDEQTNPTIATYAKAVELQFRISAKAKTHDEAKKLNAPIVQEIVKRFGDAIYSLSEEEELEDEVVKLCKERGYRITFAESCTGGLLSGRLVNVSGASEVYDRGFVTYANEAKVEELGVSPETLKVYGAVSEETAREMSIGALKVAHADVAVSVTGIAGPHGGTIEKPVGLVYIGCAVKDKVWVRKCWFNGNRTKNRESAVTSALLMARDCILEYEKIKINNK